MLTGHPVCPPCGSESPLSVATQSGLSVEGLRLLVLGGTHLDFRSRDGMTALHKAVRAHNHTGLLVRASKETNTRARKAEHEIISM